MTDLRDFKFIKNEKTDTARPHIEHGIIGATPSAITDLVPVILPEFSNELLWGPCRWTARTGQDFPSEGDDCLVAFTNRREPWILAWFPGSSYTPPPPDLHLYAPLASPVFTGDPQVPTPGAGDNDSSIANTAWVRTALASLLSSPVFTGDPQAPSPPTNDNDNSVPNTSWVNAAVAAHSPRVTASAFSGGPPGSPSDGDIWMATGVDANGTVWQFRYNAGSGSAYKWEFVGGSPFVAGTNSAPGWVTGGTYTAFPGLSLAVARAGEYSCQGGWSAFYAGNQTVECVVMVGASVFRQSDTTVTTTTQWFTTAAPPGIYTLTAGQTLALGYSVTAAPGSFFSAGVSITPRRIA